MTIELSCKTLQVSKLELFEDWKEKEEETSN